MRIVYRILILLAVFCGALLYFGSNMKEKVFSVERKTIPMQEATLPVVSIQVGGVEINLLHGYCSNLDAMLFRESITPLGADKSFALLISENEYNIKKVNFEIYETAEGSKVEEGSVISMDKELIERNGKETEEKVAKIRLKEDYAAGEEYVVKLTLISNESKRIYYYTRMKLYDNSHLIEKLDFVFMFHRSLLNKEEAGNVSKYLETKRNADETDFATANIYNSLDFLSYGEMAPEVVYEEVPAITEYTKDTASVVLKFYLAVETPAGRESYYVREYYRFRYTTARVYLFNFERHMETQFDVAATSLAKSEFKFGITADTRLEILSNPDNSRIAFVRNGSLYIYTVSDNTLTTAFTFRQKDMDTRDMYDKHNIRLLAMDDTGALDFLVYGYMNRGEYEGRVGMVLYTYHPSDQSIEERAYFPMNTTYEILKETLGDFAYCNSQEIFYFHIYDTIYSYNLITNHLEVIAKNVPEDSMVYSAEGQMLAWQSEEEAGRTDTVHVMNLETGEAYGIKAASLPAGDGEVLGLLGMIDANLILGTTKEENVEIQEDGTRLAAYSAVDITDFEGNSVKHYEKDGFYVIGAKAADNVVELERVVRSGKDGRQYAAADADYILKQAGQKTPSIRLSERVTDQMRTEYYLSMPDRVAMAAIPKSAVTKNAVITKDVTVRINTPDYFKNYYITYAYGDIVLLSKEPGAAVAQADESTGSVIGSSGRVVWSRGVKASSAELSGIRSFSLEGAANSLMACVRQLLSYRNVEADVSGYRPEERKLEEWMEQYLKADVMKLSGVTLDEALYYVYQKNPVIAVNQSGEAIFIFAYDQSGIQAVVPRQNRTRRMTLREANAFLGEREYYFLVIE